MYSTKMTDERTDTTSPGFQFPERAKQCTWIVSQKAITFDVTYFVTILLVNLTILFIKEIFSAGKFVGFKWTLSTSGQTNNRDDYRELF